MNLLNEDEDFYVALSELRVQKAGKQIYRDGVADALGVSFAALVVAFSLYKLALLVGLIGQVCI